MSTLLEICTSRPLDCDELRQLLENGLDPSEANDVGETALHQTGDNLIATELLLTYGANPRAKSQEGYTPLHYSRCPAVADLLIQKGAQVEASTRDGFTPLHCVATVPIAKILLSNGAKINQESHDGDTPLDWAYYAENTEVITFLKSKGAMRFAELH